MIEIKFSEKIAGFNKEEDRKSKLTSFTFYVCDRLFSSFFYPLNKNKTDLKSWLLRSKPRAQSKAIQHFHIAYYMPWLNIMQRELDNKILASY